MNEHAGAITSAAIEQASGYEYLSLLARVKAALYTATEVAVSTDDIRAFADQPRTYFNADSINRLSESIDAGGQTTSGIIRLKPGDTHYELIDGERRWRAIRLIPADRRPLYKAKLINADNEVVQYLVSGIANFNREQHTPIEVMETIDRFFTFGLPMKEIASLLGIGEHWAYQMHGLKKLESRVLDLLKKDRPKGSILPTTAAIEIAKIESRFQWEFAQRVLHKDIALSSLRGEIVKVGKRSGAPVREREVTPLRRWESLANNVNAWQRQAAHLRTHALTPGVLGIARARRQDSAVLLRKIRDTKEILNIIEQFLSNSER